MDGSAKSIADLGIRGTIVEIECHISNNLPAIVIVGSASKAVDEAKERVRAAFVSSGLQLPRKRITLNLAPADLPKTDSSFDLAMAISILGASRQISSAALRHTVYIGEIGLNGDLRPARGIIGKLLAARGLGYTKFVVPAANLTQAQLIPEITLVPATSLKEVYDYLVTGVGLHARNTGAGIWSNTNPGQTGQVQLSDIIGQTHAKRALEIAAAGGHNVLLSGPPGTGKSMLAKALHGLLPGLTHEEALEVTQLHSLTSGAYDTLVTSRPFRSPHHSSSLVALIGGGHNLRPGEISLAHRGVLFLDEIPEFSRSALEALRQPLEDGTITVARAKESVNYPASFILVATANPCPCGYYGSSMACSCLPHQVIQYQQRVSGPILDRIDLYSIVQDVDHRNLLSNTIDYQSVAAVRANIIRARKTEANRYDTASKLNADMTNSDIKKLARLEPAAKETLDTAASRLHTSARSYMKIVKVARTIADLADSASIATAHIAEALQYRRFDEPVGADV